MPITLVLFLFYETLNRVFARTFICPLVSLARPEGVLRNRRAGGRGGKCGVRPAGQGGHGRRTETGVAQLLHGADEQQ